jgi:cysteine desulfurase
MPLHLGPIYFDYHATTPVLPEVEQAMLPFWQKSYGNPSSLHSFGQRAKLSVEKARNAVARLLGVQADSVVFTSGATESIHTALAGWTMAQKTAGHQSCHIITSTIEHKATYGACRLSEKLGARTSLVDCDSHGFVKLDQLVQLLTPGEPTLFSIIHGNNEIGTIQNLAEISELARKHSFALHVDAAQSVGKTPVPIEQLSVDFLSISGHKVYGPKGVGALYIRDTNNFESLFSGGGQERNLRAGTHNVPGIVGLGRACEWYSANGASEIARLQKLQNRLREKLQPLESFLQINGPLQNRLPNNLNVSLKRHSLEDLEVALESVAYSSGSACNSGPQDPSHVLKAIGVDEKIAANTLRIGLGLYSTEDEVDLFCDALLKTLQKGS